MENGRIGRNAGYRRDEFQMSGNSTLEKIVKVFLRKGSGLLLAAMLFTGFSAVPVLAEEQSAAETQAETEGPEQTNDQTETEAPVQSDEPIETEVMTQTENQSDAELSVQPEERQENFESESQDTEAKSETEKSEQGSDGTKSKDGSQNSAGTDSGVGMGDSGSVYSYAGSSSPGVAGEDSSSFVKRIYNSVVYAKKRIYGEDAIPQEFTRYIFIGDSRTVGMQMSVGGDEQDCWSCKESMGYHWMVSEGIPAVESFITGNTAVFILLGINDLGNVNQYISYINSKTLEWEALGATTFFVAVGPVGQTAVTNGQIESFNSTVRNNTCAIYLDLYSELLSRGFSTQDGLHYTADTYSYIYGFIKDQAVVLATLM